MAATGSICCCIVGCQVCYGRPLARARPHSVAIVAVTRRLVPHLTALLRRDRPWRAEPHVATGDFRPRRDLTPYDSWLAPNSPSGRGLVPSRHFGGVLPTHPPIFGCKNLSQDPIQRLRDRILRTESNRYIDHLDLQIVSVLTGP